MPEYKFVLRRTPHGTITIAIGKFLLLQMSVLLVFTTHFSWTGVGICAASYAIRMFAITAFYHRYFSHRTYRMGRITQFFAAFLGATATQKGPIWWAAHHRVHHKESDTSDDPHNSHEGFWHSHWMWFLYREAEATDLESVSDLARYRELRWIGSYYFIPPVMLGFGLYAIGGWHYTVWGYFVSTFFLSNGTYTINSLMHYWGKQQYATGDESRNHLLLALITLGEGWHNSHHAFPSSARHGLAPGQLDFSWLFIQLLRRLKIASAVRQPNPKELNERRSSGISNQ